MSDHKQKLSFRAVRDSDLMRLQQRQSKTGFPTCINCGRTVPPYLRRSAARRKHGAFFCNNNCAIAWAETVASDMIIAIEWKEPEGGKRTEQHYVTALAVGQLVRRHGHTYKVLDKRYMFSSEPYGEGKIKLVVERRKPDGTLYDESMGLEPYNLVVSTVSRFVILGDADEILAKAGEYLAKNGV